jgi:hypothetical protein
MVERNSLEDLAVGRASGEALDALEKNEHWMNGSGLEGQRLCEQAHLVGKN